MTLRPLALISAVSAVLIAPTIGLVGCDKETPKPVPVDEPAAEDPKSDEERAAEMSAKRVAAIENAPEPRVDAKGYVIGFETSPRETFDFVWQMGQKQLRSIHNSRMDVLDQMRTLKFDEKADKAMFDPLLEAVTEFTIGREKEQLETAASRLCKVINDVRGPAEALITRGMAELKVIDVEFKALEAKEAEGKSIRQRTWDKIADRKKSSSRPVKGGRFVLLAVRSILEEGFVLANFGPRRAQKTLRDCLTEIAKAPLSFDLAQKELEKTLKRSKWYSRELVQQP
ncbi:MAG: hypothetical protein ACI9MR_004586 [Myxococcota bacterium]|jgi:hypothetical protein